MKGFITCLFAFYVLASPAQGLNEEQLWNLLHSTEEFDKVFEEDRKSVV